MDYRITTNLINRISILSLLICAQLLSYGQIMRYQKAKLNNSFPLINKWINSKSNSKVFAYLDSAISVNPQNSAHYYYRAFANYLLKPQNREVSAQIVKDCKNAIDLGNNDPELNYLLFLQYCDCEQSPHGGNIGGTMYINDEAINWESALDQIDSAIEKDSKNEKYLLAKVLFSFNVSLPSTNEFSFDDFYSYEIALNNLINITKSKAIKSEGYSMLCLLRLKFNPDTSLALSYIKLGIEVNPEDVSLYSLRAQIKESLGNYKSAADDYSEYLKKKQEARIYFYRGLCYLYHLNNSRAAINDFSKTIALYEQKRKANLNKPQYLFLNNEFIAKAYKERGLAYLSIGDNAKACSNFNKAIEYGLRDGNDLMNSFCD